MSAGTVTMSTRMSKVSNILRRHQIFLSRKKGLADRDVAWNTKDITVEWHGTRRLGNRRSHLVSIEFTHGEEGPMVSVYDLVDGLAILILRPV